VASAPICRQRIRGAVAETSGGAAGSVAAAARLDPQAIEIDVNFVNMKVTTAVDTEPRGSFPEARRQTKRRLCFLDCRTRWGLFFPHQPTGLSCFEFVHEIGLHDSFCPVSPLRQH
jgi:hypothetical protein